MPRADGRFSRAGRRQRRRPASVVSRTPRPTRPRSGGGGWHIPTTTSRSRPDRDPACGSSISTVLPVPNATRSGSRHGPLPATLISITSAGCHLWFRCDAPIQSSAGRVGAGLDVRGDGGYVMAPPSIHPDGPVYRWIKCGAGDRARLVDRSHAPRPPTLSISASNCVAIVGLPDAYGRAALDCEIAELASTPNGQRNQRSIAQLFAVSTCCRR